MNQNNNFAPRCLQYIFKRQTEVSVLLTLFVLTLIQLEWWIPENGFRYEGICVNHMGESYDCTILHLILVRGLFNPMAWPLLIVILFILLCLTYVFCNLSFKYLDVEKPKTKVGVSQNIFSAVLLFLICILTIFIAVR